MKIRKSLFLSDRVYRIDPEVETHSRALALGVAGASFAGSLAIAAMASSDYLLWASWCFAAAIPLSLFHAFLSSFVQHGGWSVRGSRILVFAAGQLSHLGLSLGVVFVLLHISGIAGAIAAGVGGFLWIFAVVYARIFGSTCAALDERDHEGLPDIQQPIDKRSSPS